MPPIEFLAWLQAVALLDPLVALTGVCAAGGLLGMAIDLLGEAVSTGGRDYE